MHSVAAPSLNLPGTQLLHVSVFPWLYLPASQVEHSVDAVGRLV